MGGEEQVESAIAEVVVAPDARAEIRNLEQSAGAAVRLAAAGADVRLESEFSEFGDRVQRGAVATRQPTEHEIVRLATQIRTRTQAQLPVPMQGLTERHRAAADFGRSYDLRARRLSCP